jgi:glycosyltransferase involved in cell wall biosynthesis
LSYESSNLKQPLISIVIPTYNRLFYLLQAVESVLIQTYTNWELLIADDGSEDGTIEKVRALEDKRIHILSMPHCGNVAAIRNVGAAAASGEWLTFLDSDDMFVPERLEIQLNAVQEKGEQWSYGGFELMDEAGQTISNRSGKYVPLSGWITAALLTNKTSVSIGGLMLKRKLFEELHGFNINPDLNLREDYEFALRLSMKAEAIALSQVLVRIREHYGRSTNAVDDGNKRTAYLYGHFAKHCPDTKLKRIAVSRQAHHITEMAAKNLGQKKYAQACGQFGKAFWKGDKLKHIIAAFRRGIRSKKNQH